MLNSDHSRSGGPGMKKIMEKCTRTLDGFDD